MIKKVLNYIASKSAERHLLKGKPVMTKEERKEFFSSVSDIDDLMAGFSCYENNGFAYCLPSNEMVAESLRREYQNEFIDPFTRQKISRTNIVSRNSGNYLVVERLSSLVAN